ncbi:multiprotein-bridging factor 1 family protein [Streptomyces sp. R-07]|uniref:helix-turn-helix domain-containing protein n=1 Tax=unclassified Streptomyces TaxID=2593676 RepID=UPI0037D5C102
MATRKGRPPSPVANAVNGLGKLAEYLRAARCKRELSREQLAIKLGCSITTIQRAEGGKTPPARDTLDGYIRVCVLDHTQAEALWSKAVNLCRGRTPRTYTQAPGPILCAPPTNSAPRSPGSGSRTAALRRGKWRGARRAATRRPGRLSPAARRRGSPGASRCRVRSELCTRT